MYLCLVCYLLYLHKYYSIHVFSKTLEVSNCSKMAFLSILKYNMTNSALSKGCSLKLGLHSGGAGQRKPKSLRGLTLDNFYI